jgi:hypothetical protein
MSDRVLEVGRILQGVGWDHLKQPIDLLDYRAIPLGNVETGLSYAMLQVSSGKRVLVVTSAIAENPAAISIARATETAAACVLMGVTKTKDALRTVEEIGRRYFLGTIALSDPGKSGPRKK